ncbi:S8 family serine peptidase [Massilia sp. W12]|uniref:S8 family serine peptidase n=1 Tax=Massilia sp. W12 TaxID=3126507 RepID=UPI0030CB874C
MNRNSSLRRQVLAASIAVLCANAALASPQQAHVTKIDRLLQQQSIVKGPLEALIQIKGQADKNVVKQDMHWLDKRHLWVKQLQNTHGQAQKDVLAWLEKNDIEHKSFWINNTIYVKADKSVLEELAERDDVVFIYGNPTLQKKRPLLPDNNAQALATLAGVEWGVNKINAPKVWAAGVTGAGVVIAGEDTGYKWDHPAIKNKYRGWNGTSVNHNYNWYDATHSGSSSCAPNSKTPCDDNGHGTHTVGTMVGDDGAGNQIGVAPGAKWIGCRNMIAGAGTPATYTECLQWLIAPTDVNGQNPDPSKAPDISSHSWGCTTSEGCTSQDALKTAVQNVVNAGIMVIAAAGNDGSSCSTIGDPPAVYDASLTVGSTTSTDTMSSFSSRGPVASATRTKPDLSAPGSSVRSAWSNGAYNTISGTSMATPHVAGAAALLIAANPSLRGKPEQIATLLRSTAVPVSNTQSCGGVPASTYPNPVAGYGRIDVYAAYLKAIGGTPTNNPPVANYTFSTNGLSATFTDTSTDSDGSIASRSWDFGDGTTGSGSPASRTYAAAGTYTVKLTVTDNGGASATKTQSVTVASSGGNVLQNGVAKTGLSGALNSSTTYTMAVTAGATKLKFVTSGGTGDADIYVKFGSAPTTSSYDCKSDGSTNTETCSIATAKAGTYYVLVKGYKAYSGMSLTGSFTP